jgi:hypothetical protein
MSIQFSQTASPYKGLVQFYEKEIGANYGDVSSNAEKLGEFTARVNKALDDYLLLWAKSAGTWQGDDINQTNYPIITTNIVSGQRDYSFTDDSGSNRIIDVSQVLILRSATDTNYELIYPIDELRYPLSDILLNTNTGTPFQYGKLANGIFLDPVPSYNAASGIKMIVNREGSYFTTSDTLKIPGVPAYHEYFYLKPAYEYAQIHSLSNLRELEKAVIDLEGSERLRITGKIQDFFSRRERDVRKIMTPKRINYI